MFADLQLQQILATSLALEEFQKSLNDSNRKTLYITGSAIAQIVWNFQMERDPDIDLDPFETVEAKELTDRLNEVIPAFAVAVKVRPHQIDVIAPSGLKDLFAQKLRPNKKRMTEVEFEKICRRILKQWPSVEIFSWNAAADDDDGPGVKRHRHGHQGCCD